MKFAMHLYRHEHTGTWQIHAYKDIGQGYLLYVGEVEVEAEVPEDFDAVTAKLDNLRAEAMKAQQEVDAAKQRLSKALADSQALEALGGAV